MSICHNVKTEYEALRALKQEFVSACESAKASAGSFEKLSAYELVKLQKLKSKLEQARETLEYKIENNSVRAWKKVWDKATSSIITLFVGLLPPQRETILDFMYGSDFQELFLKKILKYADDVDQGRTRQGFSWGAIAGFSAAQGLDLFTKADEMRTNEAMRREGFQKNLLYDFMTYIENFQNNNIDALNGITFFYNVLLLGFFTEEIRGQIRVVLYGDDFKENIFESIKLNAENVLRQNDTHGALINVTAFQAALRLELLQEDEIVFLQQLIEQKRFQEILVNAIEIDFQSEEGSVDCVRALSAVRDLIELSRRRLRKK